MCKIRRAILEFLKEFFEKYQETVMKILVLCIIFTFFYLTRSMFNLFLLTFMFTFLINSLHNSLVSRLRKVMKVNEMAITIIIYCLLFVLIAFAVYQYIPMVINQAMDLIDKFEKYDPKADNSLISKYAASLYNSVDVSSYLATGSNYLVKLAKNVGQWSFNIFVAIMLSLFFMLEKNKNKQFTRKLSNSRLKGIYKYLSFYSRNFLNSFGKVIQAQVLIAITNSILSVIFLWILGFPQLLALGVMIFTLSLIPVAGVIISLVPLCLIAFSIGGFIKVMWVLAMVALLHGLESYVLNPKFMSAKTELPVFFVFMILLVSENLMGFWGLLLGIPLFMFVMDLLQVNQETL